MNNLRPILKELFSTVEEPMLVVNINGEVEYLNKNAKRLLNITENIKGNLDMDENSKSSWSSFISKIREHKSSTCVLNLKLEDSKYKKVLLEGFLYKKKEIILIRLMNFLTSSYKELKEKYSSNLLDELSHGVVITNLEGTVLDVNKQALHYIGCDYEDIVNESHQLVFNKFDDFNFKKLKFYEELKTIGHASIVLRNLVDDKEMYFKIDSKLNSRKNIVVSTITNITNEMELKQRDVSKEIIQIAAAIAHEIRNPMTSLKGFIDLLKSSYSTSDEYTRYLSVMESEINRIDNYLKDMLSTTKPQQNNFKIIDIAEITKEVIEIMQPYAMKRNIIIDFVIDKLSENTPIIGNSDCLKQVLINLIKNSVEAMDKAGYITINISNINNQIVQLSVQDEGIGITKENLDKLFTPFFTTKEDGTGIGLSMVKKIVKEHYGNIKVESSINCGTTFYLEFPIYDANNEFFRENEKLFKFYYDKSVTSLPIT